MIYPDDEPAVKVRGRGTTKICFNARLHFGREHPEMGKVARSLMKWRVMDNQQHFIAQLVREEFDRQIARGMPDPFAKPVLKVSPRKGGRGAPSPLGRVVKDRKTDCQRAGASCKC